ncbi:SPFH domain-containing protein [Desulfobacter postgatei]|jgi:membrane protease subunit (stomatin/prohibitin family)|uniref:SPFH domain-containing protein n=1 Tax=Desulfobacter postgatei TaxID=2293 RepID=UPI002A3608AA|nr:SPFH domain-containing protein [Desulfobacter postgatei]MDX9962712.1 SPFH domain-containing protein [Desulfobacter postgatei]
MGTNNLIYLEVLEWFDETGQELIHRLPEKGSGEIKFGAQLIVRESQAAVFFYQGKAVGAFGPGRHTLKTANIPILTKIASLPWAMESPLKAEVFFANLKTFTNLKWGTRDPVAFKDKDLGLVRLRAFGVFNLKIVQPVLFINTLAGTQGIYTSADISDYLNQVVVSRFNDYIGENVSSIFDLPEHYDELGKGLALRLREDFSAFGLNLTHLYINAITPPPEVQQAIDDKSRLGLFDDMNKLMQMKTAMAMEKIAENPQGIASDSAQAGIGLGLGMMLPGIFSQQMLTPAGQPTDQAALSTTCPECQNQIPLDAKFCPQCGHQQVIFTRCQYCGKNITPGTRFCPRCGKQVVEKAKEKTCGNCGAKNLPNSIFCNQCGEKY